MIGLYPMAVILHPEVRANVTINVARTEEEAERQARGEDVLAEPTEEDEAPANAEAVFEESAAPKDTDDAADEDGTGEDGAGEDGTGEDGTGEDESGESKVESVPEAGAKDAKE